jgi:hypothetical protein
LVILKFVYLLLIIKENRAIFVPVLVCSTGANPTNLPKILPFLAAFSALEPLLLVPCTSNYRDIWANTDFPR